MRAFSRPKRFIVPSLLGMVALIVGFLPGLASGSTTGKLFSTRFVSPTGDVCAGNQGVAFTFEITNQSTTNTSFGSANVHIPPALSVTGTPTVNNPKWSATDEGTVAGSKVIGLRNNGQNRDQIPRGASISLSFVANVAAGVSQEFVWSNWATGAAEYNAGARVYLKQSNNFSGTGNDLIQSSISDGGKNSKATLTVKNCVDLKIEKTSSPPDVPEGPDVTVGDTVVYSVKVTNKQGSAATTGVVLTDTLPANRDPAAGVTIRSCWLNGSEVRCPGGLLQNGTIEWNIGSLSAGGTAEIRYSLRAPSTEGVQLTNRASVTSADEVFDHANCTATSSDNCASLSLDVGSREDDTARTSYLCSDPDATCTNELNVTGENSTGKFVLQSGEGSFSFSSTACVGDSCSGSEFEIVPNCEVDCRGLLILEYDHILGPRASNTIYPGPNAVAKPDIEGSANCGPEPACYWIHYKPDNDAKYDQSPWVQDDEGFIPVEKCTTNGGVSGSQSSAGYSNPPGTINDVDSVIPCVWKYFDPGSSEKLQIQVVIDREDPRLRV
jgi:uncharacterized repeat protein (TIGR01451 family)